MNKVLQIDWRTPDRILYNPISACILKLAGLKEGEMRANGIIIDFEDIIIGISAQVKQADWIISRNVKHFREFTVPCKSYPIE